MRRTIVLSFVAALGILAASAGLYAQSTETPDSDRPNRPAISRRPGDAGPGPMRMGRGRLGLGPAFAIGARNLELTDAQRTQVRELTQAARERTAPVVTELRDTQRLLHAELFADTPDRAKVEELSKQVTALQARLADLRIETTAQIAAVLTPEQTARVRDAAGREPGQGPRGPARGGRGPNRG